MNRTILKYLGMLGFLGLLGLVTRNPGFYGFFGFFGFLGLRNRPSDERLEADITRAARNAFVASTVVFAATGAAGPWVRPDRLFTWAFAGGYALQLLVFTVSIVYYDIKGNVG
ncbi:MAG: DUF3796 domain-containing protein [Ignavibacteriales bacterium]